MTFTGLAAGGSVLLSDPAEATSDMEFEAPDLEVETPDGTVEEIIIYFTVDATYSGFEEEITELGFTTDINGETVDSQDYHINHPDWLGETGPHSGDFTYRVFMHRFGTEDRIFLFEDTSFEPADFEVPEAGTSETFELDFDVEFRIISGDDVVVTRNDSSTATITIHNTESDGEGEDQDAGTEDDPDGKTSDPEVTMGVSEVSVVVELSNGDTVSS